MSLNVLLNENNFIITTKSEKRFMALINVSEITALEL